MAEKVIIPTDIRVETFEYTIEAVGSILWNVTLAKQLIERRYHAVVDIAVSDMQDIVERNEYDPNHLKNVDPTCPAIAAPILWEKKIIYVMIDGIHRCARALQDGLPFQAKLLTDDDARACWINGPMELMV